MLHVALHHYKMLLVWGIIFALIFAGISLLFPKQYSAESGVLIISRDRTGIDPYTQAKSAERIGGNLVEIMKTTDFYNKVMTTTTLSEINSREWLNLAERDRRKKWQQDVVGEVLYGASLLKVTVYAEDKKSALAFCKAVTDTLVQQGDQYVGGDVLIREVNTPLVSNLPTRPNIVLNTGIGFWVGVVISGLWVVRYKKHTLSL
jgi:capsular polysaccharide biosynthesis protein